MDDDYDYDNYPEAMPANPPPNQGPSRREREPEVQSSSSRRRDKGHRR